MSASPSDTRLPKTGDTLDASSVEPSGVSLRGTTQEVHKSYSNERRSEATAPPASDRYEDLGLLGRGGFGEVRRAFDRQLGRVVAMKTLRLELADSPRARSRFYAEIRLAASLDHPGIIAVFDQGEHADGRLWFTMPEVRGRTLEAVLDDACPLRGDGARRGPDGPERRRLLGLFARACDAMAHAHSRGVIHRDLKPLNIMVGEHGRVLVMDWGLARDIRRVPLEEDPLSGDPTSDLASGPTEGLTSAVTPAPTGLVVTRMGDVMGTPAYMAPEQARGDVLRHGPAADVYALGGILFRLLTGRVPDRGGDAPDQDAIRRRALTEAGVPSDLAAICLTSLDPDPDRRHPDAGDLAAAIEAFLSGAGRRERALEKLSEALSTGPALVELRERASALRRRAVALLSDVRPSDPVESKRPGWDLEDEAERLERDAALGDVVWMQGVHGALALDPDLPEAHEALAEHYKARLVSAERARRHEAVLESEALLAVHDRGRYAAILSGKGALSLVTDPEGARVVLERYVLRGRRLVPEVVGDIGVTPLARVPLEKGSYRLLVTAPGRAEVRIPVLIERGETWDGCPPGSLEPYPIPLPLQGELAHDEVYVPAGWAWTGGDPDATDSLPASRVWVDGFVAGRFPVTNEAYLVFLNDLVASGREREALAACPRPNQGLIGQSTGALSFARGADGLFRLDPADTVDRWSPRGPAVLMSWRGAVAYAAWLSVRTGRPYRLIHEIEREKAARGADGRLFPWGDFFDPTWACMQQSHTGAPARADVDAYPSDESPYGLRGGAGNSHDFCVNLWTLTGPFTSMGRLWIESAPLDGDDYRAVRGGGWTSVAHHCRAAARFAMRPDQRHNSTGLRVARSYPALPSR